MSSDDKKAADFEADLQAAKEKAEQLLKEGKEQVKQSAKEHAENLGAMAEDEIARLYGEKEGKLEAACEFVRDRPLLSVGVATFVGMILGKILFGRRD